MFDRVRDTASRRSPPDPFVTNPFIEILRQHIRRPEYRPATKSELARQLGIASDDRAEFRRALRSLEEAGELACGKRARYAPPRSTAGGGGGDDDGKLTGTIFFPANEKRRHGFFRPDAEVAGRDELKGVTGDVFVPARYTATAMHGDRVAVKVARREAPRWHRHVRGRRERVDADETTLEARVVAVVRRGQSRIVGTFRQHGRYAHLQPDHPSLPSTFNLEGDLLGARNGDKVVGELVAWESPTLPPCARLTEVLGRPDAPGVDILTVIHRHGLPLKFPEAVLAEADALPDDVDDEAELARREDWRDREVFTIDPEDARDFDDAIFVHAFHPEEGGGWELAVHIADVSHYVRSGSAIDREARKRGNSVYLADRVIPMLPEKLSNGLCSLKPGVDRLTHAVVMRFDPRGRQTSVRFVPAVINSRRRYTYEEAFARLNLSNGEIDHLDPLEASLGHHLKRAWDLAKLLREKRFEVGALDLDFPEVRAVLDEEGRAIDVKRSEYDESHQLIEEFMLAANEAVARETKHAEVPSLYRVHEDPDPDKLFEFSFQVGGYGHQAGDVTIRAELQKVLRSIRGKPEEHALKIALLKSLKRAAYSAEPLGHYGLAKLNYTHFTSPIRRYADLVIHRVLRRLVARRSAEGDPDVDTTPGQERLAEIAKHISETERIAADAEQETQRLKLLEYLVRISGEDKGKIFEGIVYDVRPIGAFVELTDLLIKGLIRKDDLPPGYYRYDSARNRILDPGGKFQLAVGHRVRVRLARIDRERGFIDFALAQ